MRGRALLLAGLLASSAALSEPPEVTVRMTRLSAERAGSVSIVRAERAAGGVAVTLVAGARSRLFVRRAQPEPGTTTWETWLDARPGFLVTRDGRGPLLLEAGGVSLRVHEADLGLRTVRCWVGALVSRMEPRLLTTAANVRVLKDWAGRDRLGDDFLPIRLLWSEGEMPDVSPRGELKVEEGAFTGEPWDELVRAAEDELGRP